MTDQGIKRLIARLMTDDSFRKKFSANPAKTMQASGYQLDKEEIEALAGTKVEDFVIKVVRGEGPVIVCFGNNTTNNRKKK